MRDFNFNEWGKNPDQKLLIEEFRTDSKKPKCWNVIDAKQIFGNYIVIKISSEDAEQNNISEVTSTDHTGIIYGNSGYQVGSLKFVPTVHELWGITFQYENEDGVHVRQLLQSSDKIEIPFFDSLQEAFTWISTNEIHKFVNNHSVAERCTLPLPKLIDTWIE